MLPDEPAEAERRLAPEPPDSEDAPPELRRQFWRLVVLFNLAVLSCSLGLMLAGFEGRLRDGGALVLLGLGVFAYAFRDYRRVTADADDAEQENEDKA